MMLKKLGMISLLCVVIASLAACGKSGEKAASGTAKSELVEASIDNASYILTGEDDGVSENKKHGLLAVTLKVKNVSDSDVTFLGSEDIKLYDGDKQFNPKRNVYSSEVDLEIDNSGDIGAGKVKTMTYVFDVEKDKTYEIGLHPNSMDHDQNQKSEEIKLKLDTKKYAESFDALNVPAKALTAYIDTIYLGKDNSDYEKYVTADKAALQDKAKKNFKEKMDGIFTENNISDSKLDKLYSSYQSFLAQKAKIEAKVSANAKGKAVVVLNYSAIPLSDLRGKVFDYKKEYWKNTDDYDPKKSEKYALSKFDTILNKLDPKEGHYDLKVLMIQKDGKWTVDNSDENSAEEISNVFAAGEVY